MSGIGFWELFLVFIIGLLILGPERLPRVASQIGRWVGRARRTANQLRYQLEREIALADIEKNTQKREAEKAKEKKESAQAAPESPAEAAASAPPADAADTADTAAAAADAPAGADRDDGTATQAPESGTERNQN